MKHNNKKRIVVVGGGTGTHTVLMGLKKYADEVDLTAIVAMTDSGGSTGRLRDEFGYLPVGDVRMALAALARENDEHEALVRKLFLHRFVTDGEVSGHNFGNLFLVALTDILGSEEEAIRAASQVLRVCGRVIPVTNEKVHLVATYADGVEVIGEHEIDEPDTVRLKHRITALRVTPKASLNVHAQAAIEAADMLVIGPGDLYTSVLANFVVDGFPEALTKTKGKIVYVSNLMTRVGQTSGMGVRAHVDEIVRYGGHVPHIVISNNAPLPANLLHKYEAKDEHPVLMDYDPALIIAEDLLATEEIVKGKGDVLKRSFIRHDSDKLAHVLMHIIDAES